MRPALLARGGDSVSCAPFSIITFSDFALAHYQRTQTCMIQLSYLTSLFLCLRYTIKAHKPEIASRPTSHVYSLTSVIQTMHTNTKQLALPSRTYILIFGAIKEYRHELSSRARPYLYPFSFGTRSKRFNAEELAVLTRICSCVQSTRLRCCCCCEDRCCSP